VGQTPSGYAGTFVLGPPLVLGDERPKPFTGEAGMCLTPEGNVLSPSRAVRPVIGTVGIKPDQQSIEAL